jgi:hypothetical protein
MPPISKISPTNNNNNGGVSTKKKRMGVLPFGLIVTILSLCCMLSLAVSFLHGSVLHGLPEIHTTTTASGGGHPASAAALKSSLLESISSGAAGGVPAGVDHLPANGGNFRSILPSDLRLGKLSCEKYGGPSDVNAKEMVYWVCFPSHFLGLIPMCCRNCLIIRVLVFSSFLFFSKTFQRTANTSLPSSRME